MVHRLACFTKYYYSNHFREDAMGGACSTHGIDEKFMQNFSQKT